MSRFGRVNAGVRRYSAILDALEEGASPAELKQEMVQTLKSFFRNPEILDSIQPEIGVTEAVNVQKIEADPWALERFEHCLDLYRKAHQQDPARAVAEIERWDPATRQALRHYWSLVQLEHSHDSPALEDYAVGVFQLIGSLLEACTQPYARELLAQVRIARAKDPEPVSELEFGNVISELRGTTPIGDLFAPPPWGVPLNQWRNTPQHFNYRVANDQIYCWYGKGDRKKEFKLEREELLRAATRMIDVFRIIRTARTVYFLDNLTLLRKRIPPGEEREDAALFNFVALAATLGFEVVDSSVAEGRAVAVLQEVTAANPSDRMIHASQFVVQLWRQTKSDVCVVEYRDKSGDAWLRASADGKLCEAVVEGAVPVSELAKRVDLQLLRDRSAGGSA